MSSRKCPDGQCSLVIDGEEVFCEYCQTRFVQCLPDEDGLCDICGLPFNEDGVCFGDHHLSAWYPLDAAHCAADYDEIDLEEDDFVQAWRDERQQVECQIIGYRCSICGASFGDNAWDTVCQNGHEIGQEYYV